MTGENGQIIADIASDGAFEGYWRRSDSDARALRGGWYFTGDTGMSMPIGICLSPAGSTT